MALIKYDYQTPYSDNTSGYRGISFDRRISRWEVKVCCDNIRRRIGRFANLDDAVAARDAYLSQQPD